MSVAAAVDRSDASAAALVAGDPLGVWPEPEWLQAVAGDSNFDWARIQWRRSAATPGAWYDHAKAQAVVELWPRTFTLTSDRFAGKPFRLANWQDITVRLLVGWKVPEEILDPDTHQPVTVWVRLFRRLRLWVPRKNGKSEFLAAMALLFWAIDGVMEGEGYCFARDEKQARIAFRKMKAMIANNAELAAGCQVHAKSIYLKELRSVFELLSGTEEGKHGKAPTVTLGDEMHEWRSREVSNTLRQGSGNRLQPIELEGSTAGLKTNPTGVELWDESLAILDGRLADATTLVVIFAADPDADWRDETVWAGANPSLGLSPTLGFLRREAALAEGNPRAEAHFRRYHLNQWVDSVARWIPLKKWDACTSNKEAWKLYPQTLRGRLCFGAFDVSSTRDVTALTWLFPPTEDDPKFRSISRFWVPEETLEQRVKDDRVPYDKFLAAGALTTTPGDYVDQNYVQAAILEGINDFDVQRIGFDPWNARKLVSDIEATGVPIETFQEMRQGIPTLGEPSKHFERLVYSGQFDHGGQPVLRWMAGNAVVKFDDNMNFCPHKKRAAEKIDGIVACVMATGLACGGEPDQDAESYLETESALFV